MTIDEFTVMLDEYMVWYRDKRIKTEYGMSIMDKRIQLGSCLNHPYTDQRPYRQRSPTKRHHPPSQIQ